MLNEAACKDQRTTWGLKGHQQPGNYAAKCPNRLSTQWKLITPDV